MRRVFLLWSLGLLRSIVPMARFALIRRCR